MLTVAFRFQGLSIAPRRSTVNLCLLCLHVPIFAICCHFSCLHSGVYYRKAEFRFNRHASGKVTDFPRKKSMDKFGDRISRRKKWEEAERSLFLFGALKTTAECRPDSRKNCRFSLFPKLAAFIDISIDPTFRSPSNPFKLQGILAVPRSI